MPILPAFPAYAVGDTLPPELGDRFYDPAADSFELLDGKLDSDNLTSRISRGSVRPRSLIEFGTVAGTGAFDVLENLVDSEYETLHKIPGLCTRLYLKSTPKLVLVTWGTNMAGDENLDLDATIFTKLFIDGVYVDSHKRYMADSYDNVTPKRRPSRDRLWSGAYVCHEDTIALGKGWHDIGLAVYKPSGPNQARHRIRRLNWVIFY